MSWKDYEKAAEKGPTSLFWKIFISLIGMILLIGALGYVLGWFGEAAQVAKEEFGPKAALEKYEWFIDRSNMIDKMDQDVAIFKARLTNVEDSYKTYGADPAKWPPHIQIQYNKERQTAYDDLVAVVSQRNNLAREYDAASEKFNWKPFQSDPRKPKERFYEYKIQ